MLSFKLLCWCVSCWSPCYSDCVRLWWTTFGSMCTLEQQDSSSTKITSLDCIVCWVSPHCAVPFLQQGVFTCFTVFSCPKLMAICQGGVMVASTGGVIPTMGEELWRIAIPASAILSVTTSLPSPQSSHWILLDGAPIGCFPQWFRNVP